MTKHIIIKGDSFRHKVDFQFQGNKHQITATDMFTKHVSC